MTDDALGKLIHQLINETISEDDHARLQQQLGEDPQARAIYRERMDLEAALHTWAVEDTPGEAATDRPSAADGGQSGDLRTAHRGRFLLAGVVAVAAAALTAFVLWGPADTGDAKVATDDGVLREAQAVCGRLIEGADCGWKQTPSPDGRFTTGMLELTAGVAELQFASGTNVVLESPCVLHVESADSARLLAGSVYVDVTEVSNGFLLTTPEASIVDEGTQYAVSLSADATEVHVFDGSVLWMTADTTSNFEQRILSGEARRFSRSEPQRPHHIPFGQRQFVRRVEARIRDAAGGQLLAYDGFENLAGRLRRGRSGFGWAAGWEAAGRGHGQLADVQDAPSGTVFGLERAGRRLLSLPADVDMRRRLDLPVDLSPGSSLYLSLLLQQSADVSEGSTALQVSLEPDSDSPRYLRRHSVSWGITSAGLPYLNNAGTVLEAGVAFPPEQTCLVVVRYAVLQRGSEASLRVYRPGEPIDDSEPDVWTVSDVASARANSFHSFRVNSGAGGSWRLDELKIGTSWSAITPSAAADAPRLEESR